MKSNLLVLSLFAVLHVACASSSSSEPASGGSAPGATCEAASACQAYTCSCASGQKVDNARVCENKTCATEKRTCEASCEATSTKRTPTGAGNVAVCDDARKAFAACPPSTQEIEECKTLVGDANCGKTAETYYSCANTHATCIAGPSAPDCSQKKTDAQTCTLAF